MGNLWIPDADEWLRAAGLNAREFDTKTNTRSRVTGGYDDILAIQIHHDASGVTWTPQRTAEFLWYQHEFRPVGSFCLGRGAGEWIFGAAGATNTSGLGGPRTCSRGTIPKDQANKFVISVEAQNNGGGERWSADQLMSYARGVAALIKGLGQQGAYDGAARAYRKIKLNPLHRGDVHGHSEYAPERKIDPAGPPSPYAISNDEYKRWNMDMFRQDVNFHYLELSNKGEKDMIPVNRRMLDSRKLGGPFIPSTVYPLGLPSWIPSNAAGLMLGLTYVSPNTEGHVESWAFNQNRPPSADRTSVLNPTPLIPVNGRTAFVDCRGGGFNLWLERVTCHLIIDIQGYSL